MAKINKKMFPNFKTDLIAYSAEGISSFLGLLSILYFSCFGQPQIKSGLFFIVLLSITEIINAWILYCSYDKRI
jgi:hypothetical protein